MAETKIRSFLRTKNELLYSRFAAAEPHFRSMLEYNLSPRLQLTTHSVSHVTHLEGSYDWLLDDEDFTKMNGYELFILLNATYCHDILMVARRPGEETIARETHSKGVDRFLEENRMLGISPAEAITIADVVRGHHVDLIDELPEERVLGNDRVDIRKLGACLSLADICHADSSRAPQIVFDYLRLEPNSREHWRRHLQISGVTRLSGEILMSAYCFSDEGAKSVEKYRSAVEDQLNRVKPYFKTRLVEIQKVRLDLTRMSSPVDAPLEFRGNIPRIIRLLIDGVYARDDVFIRELVQNALDANYLAQAEAFRSSSLHRPRIVVSAITDGEDELIAVRVDDNGIGMSAAEVADSLLTIAVTQADDEGVKQLLEQTGGKRLIANFGIGVLSCLKLGERVDVSTQRKGNEGVSLTFSGVDEEIQPTVKQDDTIGSTFIVWLREGAGSQLDLSESLSYYCVDVRQADLSYLRGENLATLSRGELFALADVAGEPVEPNGLSPGEHFALTEISGEGFSGYLWLSIYLEASTVGAGDSGEMVILNDGILVSRDLTEEWLPGRFKYVDGYVNLHAGRVPLSASRDALKQGVELRSLKADLAAVSERLISTLANATKGRSIELIGASDEDFGSSVKSSADLACYALAYSLESTGKPLPGQRTNEHLQAQRLRFFQDLSSYTVPLFPTGSISLHELFEGTKPVYVVYGGGRHVDYLTSFQGRKLYHKQISATFMQASILAEAGEVVVQASHWAVSPRRINELQLLSDYATWRGTQILDVVTNDVVTSMFRSRGVPASAREALGSDVKFISVPRLSDSRSWTLEGRLLINIDNPEMAKLYEIAKSIDDDEQAELLAIVAQIMRAQFDSAAERLLNIVADRQGERRPDNG